MVKVDVCCHYYCHKSAAVRELGKRNSGYHCYVCCKTFQLKYTHQAGNPDVKELFVDMAMNNAGARDTARVLKIDVNTVIRMLKNLTPKSVTYLPLEGNEILLTL